MPQFSLLPPLYSILSGPDTRTMGFVGLEDMRSPVLPLTSAGAYSRVVNEELPSLSRSQVTPATQTI